jgi:hypothetical protein
MPRFRLRTLLIVLALGPPVLAWLCWPVVRRIMHPPPERIQGNMTVIGPLSDDVWRSLEIQGSRHAKRHASPASTPPPAPK